MAKIWSSWEGCFNLVKSSLIYNPVQNSSFLGQPVFAAEHCAVCCVVCVFCLCVWVYVCVCACEYAYMCLHICVRVCVYCARVCVRVRFMIHMVWIDITFFTCNPHYPLLQSLFLSLSLSLPLISLFKPPPLRFLKWPTFNPIWPLWYFHFIFHSKIGKGGYVIDQVFK